MSSEAMSHENTWQDDLDKDRKSMNERLEMLTRELGPLATRAIVSAFFADAPERITELSQGMTEKNLKKIKRALHTLYGGFSNLGATSLANFCRHLEYSSEDFYTDAQRCSESLKIVQNSYESLKADCKNNNHI